MEAGDWLRQTGNARELSLDRFEGDRVAVLRYAEVREGREAGLQVSGDSPSNDWNRASP